MFVEITYTQTATYTKLVRLSLDEEVDDVVKEHSAPQHMPSDAEVDENGWTVQDVRVVER